MAAKSNEECREEYEGKIYQSHLNGPMLVLSYSNALEVRMRFLDTNAERIVSMAHIKRGMVKDVMRKTTYGIGYIGSERHLTRKGDNQKGVLYTQWKTLLRYLVDKQLVHVIDPTYLSFTEYYDARIEQSKTSPEVLKATGRQMNIAKEDSDILTLIKKRKEEGDVTEKGTLTDS